MSKWFLTGQHKNFFFDRRHILLEGVISHEEIELALLRIGDSSLAKDLFLDNTYQQFFYRKVNTLALDLLDENQLRLAADVYFSQNVSLPYFDAKLIDWFSLRPLVLGALLCLESEKTSDIKNELDFFPIKQGDLLLFSNKFYWPYWKRIIQGKYILLVYAKSPLMYVKNNKDPFEHRLKEQGFVFGDKIPVKTHPLILS